MLDQDDFPIAGSFDPNDTLPQIWEGDPDATLPYMLGDDILDDSDLKVNTNGASGTISGDHTDLPTIQDIPIIQKPRQTRAGRKDSNPCSF